jgi:dethiobiotin synthetase
MSIIIAGIHTGIGKTVCSALICQATGYDYWKPVQAGDLDHSDSMFIRTMVSNPACFVHPERYRLTTAASPHQAAAIDGIRIQKTDFTIPESKNNILVETAGGLMSPAGNDFLAIDLIEHLRLPVILVSGNYLGSINHTLLSIDALKQRNIPIVGLVFSGEENPSSESFILAHTGSKLLFRIPMIPGFNKKIITTLASQLNINIS